MVETERRRATTRSAEGSCQRVGCSGSRGTEHAGDPQTAQAEQRPRSLGAVKCQNHDGSGAGRVTPMHEECKGGEPKLKNSWCVALARHIFAVQTGRGSGSPTVAALHRDRSSQIIVLE